jgi:hypothetical protein
LFDIFRDSVTYVPTNTSLTDTYKHILNFRCRQQFHLQRIYFKPSLVLKDWVRFCNLFFFKVFLIKFYEMPYKIIVSLYVTTKIFVKKANEVQYTQYQCIVLFTVELNNNRCTAAAKLDRALPAPRMVHVHSARKSYYTRRRLTFLLRVFYLPGFLVNKRTQNGRTALFWIFRAKTSACAYFRVNYFCQKRPIPEK